MGWIEQRQQALAAGVDKSSDDMVARRVLNGLDLVERELAPVERALFGESNNDALLWARVEAVLKTALRRKMRTPPSYEALHVNGKHTDMIERYGEMRAESPVIARSTRYLARVGKTKKCLVYFVVVTSEPQAFSIIRCPFHAVARWGDDMLLVQEIEKHIEQYGPYDWKTYLQQN